jgi:hypothetical protein
MLTKSNLPSLLSVQLHFEDVPVKCPVEAQWSTNSHVHARRMPVGLTGTTPEPFLGAGGGVHRAYKRTAIAAMRDKYDTSIR